MGAEHHRLLSPGEGVSADRSGARVVFFLGERRDAERATQCLFHRKLQTWEYAGLAGAPDDAEVEVGTFQDGLYVEMGQPVTNEYRAVQLVRPTDAGPAIVIDALRIRNTMRRKGLGLKIFSRQLATAVALGVKRIETVAGRGDGENGYYTWPRFGFDGPLPSEIKRNLPLGLDHAQYVLDLMEDEQGRLWWRAFGFPVRLAFDLRARSRSWHVLRRYLDRKRGLAGRAYTTLGQD
jgi:hypothetical protein